MPPVRTAIDDATRARIISAASEIAAEQGYAALSMRALAERSGIATMTLYRHVSSKERLLSMLAEEAFAALELPEQVHEDWREEVLGIFRAAHALLRKHQELVEIVARQHMNGRPSFAAGERAMRAMRRGGMRTERAAEAFVAMISYLIGVTQRQLYRDGENIADAWNVIQDLPADEFSNIVATAHLLIPRPPDHILENGLRMLLDGYAA